MLVCAAGHPVSILYSVFLLAVLCWLSGDRRISQDIPHNGIVRSRSWSLPDLLACIRLPGSSAFETSLTLRSSHFHTIDEAFGSMIRSPLPAWCFARFCGPSIEGLCMGLRVRPLTDFGAVVLVVFPWLLSRWYFCNDGLQWENHNWGMLISQVFNLRSPIFVYTTVIFDELGICTVDGTVRCLPTKLLLISPWDWGRVPFLAFLRIASSRRVLPEQYHMCFVGNTEHHPLRRQLIREIQILSNASIFISGKIRGWERIDHQWCFVLVPR
jgi:hypothetical protein